MKYNIEKHPNYNRTEDGKAKSYIHNDTNRAIATISLVDISLKDIEKINVPDFDYELLAEFELDKEFEDTEEKS